MAKCRLFVLPFMPRFSRMLLLLLRYASCWFHALIFFSSWSATDGRMHFRKKTPKNIN